jgi:hypothetical protein
MRNVIWITSIAIFLYALMTIPHTTQAQEEKGTISGTVYRDINANGICVNEGEPRVAANIPMELVSDDVGELLRITTAADGSYAYTTDALGLWSVTVVPGENWRVTSQQTLEVVLSTDSLNATGIDFCIIEIEQSSGGGGTTLPESGAPVAPALLIASVIGFILIAAGASLLLVNHLHTE